MIFWWNLVCFEILYQLPVVYPLEDPLGALPDPKEKSYITFQYFLSVFR